MDSIQIMFDSSLLWQLEGGRDEHFDKTFSEKCQNVHLWDSMIGKNKTHEFINM